MTYTQKTWKNPDGATVTIWVASENEFASIGEGASIGVGDTSSGQPLYIAPLPTGPSNYYITATRRNLAIGWELRSLEWWHRATDKEIIALDGKSALEYWRVAKPLIFSILEIQGMWTPPNDGASA